MGRLRAPVAAGLATLAVACVLFPWWRAGDTPVLLVDGPPAPLAVDAWTGVELLGAPPSIGLAVLAAIGLGLPDRWALPVAGLVGGATAASAGRVLATWGPGATSGLWAAVVLGVTAVGLAVGRPRVGAVPVVAAALVGGLAAGLLPATGTAVADGPFVRLADLTDGGLLRRRHELNAVQPPLPPAALRQPQVAQVYRIKAAAKDSDTTWHGYSPFRPIQG